MLSRLSDPPLTLRVSIDLLVPCDPRYWQRPLEFIGYDTVDVRLEEREHGEPNVHPFVALLESAVVCERVVVEKEARRDVERYKDVDGVVLVGGQEEEDSKEVDYPRCRVKAIKVARGIW